MYSHRLEV